MSLTDKQRDEIKSILMDLGMAAPRTAVALRDTALLVEVQAWLHLFAKLSDRFDKLDLDFEALATTVARMPDSEIPGSVVLTDLTTLGIPDDARSLT